jgi:hypothetical protein
VAEGLELTKVFTAEEYERALESWSWVGLGAKEPVFTSLFGDIVFEDGSGIWFLSMLDGTLECAWPDRGALRESLAAEEGQDMYLLAGLAFGAYARGVVLGPEQVYNFEPPPILGGPIDVEHLVPTDFVVAVNLAGQLHGQIKDLPPGTRISGFSISDPPANPPG